MPLTPEELAAAREEGIKQAEAFLKALDEQQTSSAFNRALGRLEAEREIELKRRKEFAKKAFEESRERVMRGFHKEPKIWNVPSEEDIDQIEKLQDESLQLQKEVKTLRDKKRQNLQDRSPGKFVPLPSSDTDLSQLGQRVGNSVIAAVSDTPPGQSGWRELPDEEEDRIPLESEIAAPSGQPQWRELPDDNMEGAWRELPGTDLQGQRAEIMAELDDNPFARKLTMQMLDTEGGGVATMEALVNRTAMIRQKVPGWKISDELTSGFYGPINSGYAQKRDLDPGTVEAYQKHIDEVRAGSNVIQGRTDQGYPGDANSSGPGRVIVPDNPREVYNYWTGKRLGMEFSHADSAKFAMELEGEAPSLAPSRKAPLYTAGPKPSGMVEQGNIDLGNRPIIKNPDGTISTEKSFSISDESGNEVLIPQIVNGKELSQKEAIEHYYKTGEHMGKFKDAESADAYAEVAHNRPMPTTIEPAASKEVPAKKEVGLIESAKRGVMSSSLGIGEAVNRYAYSPVVHGISEAIQAVAPESEVAKKAKEFDDAFFKHTVEEPAQMRKKLEFDPETEKRTVLGKDLGKTGEVAGELAEIGGALGPDIATAALTQGATAVKAVPTALKTAAPTILNAIKSYAPQLAVGARSFIVPAMKSGMDAAKQAKEQGASEVDQNAAFLEGTLKTMAMAAVPMATESKLATLPARIASRTAQGGALAGATGELERTGSNIVLGEGRPFSPVESLKQVVTGGTLGAAMGRKGEPARKVQSVEQPSAPVDQRIQFLREAGIKPENVNALLSGGKTVTQVVDAQLKDFAVPRVADETRTQAGGRGHAEAMMEARDWAIARIENILAEGATGYRPILPVIKPPPIPAGPEPRIKPLFATTKKIVGEKVKIKGIEADPGRFIQGTAEIMEKSGFTALGQAIRDHIDRWRQYSGMTHAPIRRWAKGMNKEQLNQAYGEFKNYWQSVDEQWRAQAAPGQPVTNASNAIYNAASPKGREIIDISKRLFSETGDIALANRLEVFNHETGKWRPFRKIAEGRFFPRRISTKWLEILSKPMQYPAEYAEIRREAVALGYIKQPADFDAYVSRALKTHTPDDLSPIEHARTSPLPTRVYDYGFDQMINYLNNWSWDMARIEAFGQKSRGKLDLFEKSQELTTDTYSKGYIRDVQNVAYRKQNSGGWSATLNGAQTVSTISMLGNYLSSMRNALGGIKYNAHYNGVSAAAKAFFRVHEMAAHVEDANERGILQDNLFSVQEDVSNLKSPLQKGLEVTFKYTGQKLAEDWTRAMTLMAARDFLRNSVAENQRDPASPKMIQIRAQLQRLGPGINTEKLLREGGQAGPLTDRFLRQNVATIQGGYQYDMTPRSLNTPGGRLIFQFQKWGTQAADIFVKNVANPAVQAISEGKLGKQETVQVPDGRGGMREVKVPGALLPAARFLLLSTAAGLTQKELQSFIFGIEDKEASFAEILTRLDKGDAKAFGDLIHKVWLANMSVGAAGVIGNYSQLLTDIGQRTRFKDPSAPPALALPKAVVGLLIDRVNQGTLTPADWDAFARNVVSGYRTVQGIGSQLNDAFGGNILPLKAVSNRNDLVFLRSRTRRYDNVIGVAPSTFGGAPPSKTALTPFTSSLKEALMMGDSLRAGNLMDAHFAGKTRAEREVEMKRIKASVRGSQPIRAGGGSGEAMAANFLDWAGENLPMTEVMRIIDIDNRYVSTATGLRLMDPRDPTMKERRAALQRIENRRAFRK